MRADGSEARVETFLARGRLQGHRKRLAPVGSGKFGADQCKNDKDGSVDHDERLPITGLAPGRYDLKIGYKGGKTCMVANVAIEGGKAFSIEDKDLKDCSTGPR